MTEGDNEGRESDNEDSFSDSSSSSSAETAFSNPLFYHSKFQQTEIECLIAKKRYAGVMKYTKAITDSAIEEARLYSSLKNTYHGSEMMPNTYVLAQMVSRGTKLAVAKWCGANVCNTVDQVGIVTLVRRWRTKEALGDDTAIIESQKYANKIEFVTESHADIALAQEKQPESGEEAAPKVRINPLAYVPPEEPKRRRGRVHGPS